MRILKEFKIPNLKFPKFKMKGLSEIEEVKIDYEKVQKHQEEKNKKNDKVYETTSFETVREIFNNSIKEFENNTFLLESFDHKENFTNITYKEFGNKVKAFSTGLIKYLGLKENDKVIIIGENTYNWYISYMSLLCSNIIAVPVDKELPENEIVNIINRSKATAVIYSPKKKDEIKKVQENEQTVKYFIQMYSDDELNNHNIGFNNIIKIGENLILNGDNTFENVKVDPDEFKILLFTSGTTSAAKGVMLSNRNLAENVNASLAYVQLKSTDRLFSILPLHHTYESSIGFIFPFGVGASVAVCRGLKYILPDFKITKPTSILAVPLLVENLYKKINANIKKSKKETIVNSMIHLTNALKSVNIDVKRKVFSEIYENLGGKLRIIVSAAAPIDPKIGKWLEDIGITFLQGYGLTETAPIAALTPDFNAKIGSAGKPVICAEIKIENPNEKGEGLVFIKSKTLMLGYYEDEKATKEVIDNGWFNSGDIGYLDNDGFLYITGRYKNVIVTQNGKNIYPEEIELLLSDIPEIKECMVYGKEEKGEKELIISVKAIPNYDEIEAKYGKNLDDKEIYKIIWGEIKKVNKKLVSYKAIKNLEIKKDEFIKTTTMKIKRYEEIKKDKQK